MTGLVVRRKGKRAWNRGDSIGVAAAVGLMVNDTKDTWAGKSKGQTVPALIPKLHNRGRVSAARENDSEGSIATGS